MVNAIEKAKEGGQITKSRAKAMLLDTIKDQYLPQEDIMVLA